MIYESIKHALESNDDFIYLKKSVFSIKIFPFNKLYGVICDLGDDFIKNSGLPKELVKIVDLSVDSPKMVYENDGDVVYFSSNGNDSAEQVLSIIKIFNLLSSIKITIYTNSDVYSNVNMFSNSNIAFQCFSSLNDMTINASLMITYGYYARSFVKQKIPTIIIGPYGFGGWVTPDNIGYMLNDNFKGRPNGVFNETIPLEILVDELMEIKESSMLQEYLDENVIILNKYLNKFSIKNIKAEIESIKNNYENFKNISKRPFLKPKLASNANVIKNNDGALVQRKVINDLLFSLPESDVQLLEDLKGELTCQFLQEKYKMEYEEFWSLITSLWERKAIVFI